MPIKGHLHLIEFDLRSECWLRVGFRIERYLFRRARFEELYGRD